MSKKRILTIGAMSLTVMVVLGCMAAILLSLMQSSAGMQTPSQYAYQACRTVMLNTDGYGVWKLKDSQYRIIFATYAFSDGFNEATCRATGFGSFWHVTSTIQTLVGCAQALTDTGGNECPRAKFGVSP